MNLDKPELLSLTPDAEGHLRMVVPYSVALPRRDTPVGFLKWLRVKRVEDYLSVQPDEFAGSTSEHRAAIFQVLTRHFDVAYDEESMLYTIHNQKNFARPKAEKFPSYRQALRTLCVDFFKVAPVESEARTKVFKWTMAIFDAQHIGEIPETSLPLFVDRFIEELTSVGLDASTFRKFKETYK